MAVCPEVESKSDKSMCNLQLVNLPHLVGRAGTGRRLLFGVPERWCRKMEVHFVKQFTPLVRNGLKDLLDNLH